jgi:hypothetical protein
MLGLAFASIALAAPAATRAQGQGVVPTSNVQTGWAEVVTVTPKWLVLRNPQGQQFPVALSKDHVGLFVIRWPTTPDRLSAQAVIEANGYEVGNNQIRTDHIDVFENDAKGLLGGYWPSVTTLTAGGVVVTPYNVNPNYAYLGYDYLNAVLNTNGMPNRVHVVAPVISALPMVVAVGNNNTMSILPAPAGLTLTQVTNGSSSFVRKGDLAYYVSTGTTPKSLLLTQLVIYKPMPLNQFVP